VCVDDENCSQGECARTRLCVNASQLQYQQPANEWEYYICTQLRERFDNIIPTVSDVLVRRLACMLYQVDVQRSSVMRVDRAVVYTNASVMFNELAEHGTLLVCLHVRSHAGCSRP
jgi:hypothetical protein